MRIIGGEKKGRKLKTLPGRETRPTLDKVRGSIFNALYDLSGVQVLDLFGGSGAFALEALSRGAAKCVIVDHSAAAIKIIQDNVTALDYNARVEVRKKDFLRAVEVGEKFDLIFLDPPYKAGLVGRSMAMICELSLLTSDGMIVVETAASHPEYTENIPFKLVKEKQYGKVKILYYRFNEE